MPISAHAFEVKQTATTCLVGWVRVLCEDFGLEPPIRDIRAICAWISSRMRYVRRHEASADMWTEIVELGETVRRAVDRHPERLTPVTAGLCPSCGARWSVGPELLLVDIPARLCEGNDGACTQKLDLRGILDQRLVTEREVCWKAMDGRRLVNEKTFDSWVRRGRLVNRGPVYRIGPDGLFHFCGAEGYRLGEIRELVARHAETKVLDKKCRKSRARLKPSA